MAMMQGGSKTFFAASRLLPLRIRAASVALYAFCRVADDRVDHGTSPEWELQQLRCRLDRIYSGTPEDFIEDQALAVVVQQFQLPRLYLDALLEGFDWDAQARRYTNMDALQDYAARVAGTVGAMMCWIMGARSPMTLARACELGVAMQLTNIARDIGEDAKAGRIYLPLDWLANAGISPESWLNHPVATPAIKHMAGRLLDHAELLYQRSQAGIAELPPDCRAAILSASTIYSEIGHQLRRDGLDSVHQRTVVSTRRKLVLLASAWTQARWIYAETEQPDPLPAVAFLVEGGKLAAGPSGRSRFFPNRAMPQRIEWLINLFERLETQRRRRHSTSLSG